MKMVSWFLRRRFSASIASCIRLHDNTTLGWIPLELKCRISFAASNSLRKFGSFSSATKFDFTDLTCPQTWYPNARKKTRNVILHVGPTNSGKTHQALKRLETSSSGIYCGPLRLLAWEVAKRLKKEKVPCDLITGQEREEVDGAQHKAVTVEMADVTSDYDCAVIDEIQMLGCRTRGYSFTRALLGICANELHLCGDPASVPLIEEMLKVTGDSVKVQYYERLSPLVPLEVPLGSFSNIRTGDCIVTFSRQKIYGLKKQIEAVGKHLCSVVYGSLPPETRTRQDCRQRCSTTQTTRELTVPEIKQIAGRAGRYGSKFPVGEVTCLDAEDLPLLHSSLKSASPTLERAGLFPSFDLLFMYSRLHQNHGLHQILGLIQFAQNYSKKGLVRLREIFTPGTLKVPKTHTALKELESIHKVLDLYVWLSFRLEESFPDRELASTQKAICSLLIEEFLERFGGQKSKSRRLSRQRILNSQLSSNMD